MMNEVSLSLRQSPRMRRLSSSTGSSGVGGGMKKAGGFIPPLRLSYKSPDGYSLEREVALGALGVLRVGVRDSDGQAVTVKTIDKMKCNRENKGMERTRREVDALRTLSHSHIVKFVDAVETDSEFHVITEYCVGGDLYEYLYIDERAWHPLHSSGERFLPLDRPSPRRRGSSSPSPLTSPPSANPPMTEPKVSPPSLRRAALNNSNNNAPTSLSSDTLTLPLSANFDNTSSSLSATTNSTTTTTTNTGVPNLSLPSEETGYRIDEPEAKRLFKQLIQAVEYCHSQGIVHRDIKPENILLDDKLDVHLSEFGLCLRYDSKGAVTDSGSSLAYSSPEMLRQLPFVGPESDIWRAVLYEMVAGRAAFEGATEEKLCLNILTGEYIPLESGVSVAVADLIHRMLKVDISQRATLEQIKSHPWLSMEMPTLGAFARKSVPRSRTPHSPRTRLVPRSPRLTHISSHLSPVSPRLCLSPRSPRSASPRGSFTYGLMELEAERELNGRAGVGIRIGNKHGSPIKEFNLVRSMTRPLTEEELVDMDWGDLPLGEDIESLDLYSAQNPCDYETGQGRPKRRSSLGSPRGVSALFRFVETIPSKNSREGVNASRFSSKK